MIPLCADVSARESARAIVRALDPDADVDGAPESGLWRVKYVVINHLLNSILIIV